MLCKKCLTQGIQKTKVTLFYKTYISRNPTHSYPRKQNITDGNNIEILFDEERYFHNLFPPLWYKENCYGLFSYVVVSKIPF
jgi:hypothetical protein